MAQKRGKKRCSVERARARYARAPLKMILCGARAARRARHKDNAFSFLLFKIIFTKIRKKNYMIDGS